VLLFSRKFYDLKEADLSSQLKYLKSEVEDYDEKMENYRRELNFGRQLIELKETEISNL